MRHRRLSSGWRYRAGGASAKKQRGRRLGRPRLTVRLSVSRTTALCREGCLAGPALVMFFRPAPPLAPVLADLAIRHDQTVGRLDGVSGTWASRRSPAHAGI